MNSSETEANDSSREENAAENITDNTVEIDSVNQVNDKKNSKNSAKNNAIIRKARARRFAMQAVYQYLMTNEEISEIVKQIAERETNDYDHDFLAEIIYGVAKFRENFELQLAPFLDRKISDLDKVEHAILLVGVYELNSKSTPPAVAINEAIIIAKKFASDDSHKYINGVLDKLYKNLKNKI